MFSPKEFKEAASEEIRVIRHIATKIAPEKVDWRPSEAQRSIAELLRYLAICGIAPARSVHEENWKLVDEYVTRHENLDLAGFDRAMADQDAELAAFFDGLPEADLTERRVTLPWGPEHSLGEALYQTTVKFLTAYRMQLFLYAKQSGDSSLSTYDAWLGIDTPQKAEA